MLNGSMHKGQWLIVRYNNTSWQSIKRVCSQLTTNQNLNENFRLWIIIEESHTFPLDVLRMSLKGNLFLSFLHDIDLDFYCKSC